MYAYIEFENLDFIVKWKRTTTRSSAPFVRSSTRTQTGLSTIQNMPMDQNALSLAQFVNVITQHGMDCQLTDALIKLKPLHPKSLRPKATQRMEIHGNA